MLERIVNPEIDHIDPFAFAWKDIVEEYSGRDAASRGGTLFGDTRVCGI